MEENNNIVEGFVNLDDLLKESELASPVDSCSEKDYIEENLCTLSTDNVLDIEIDKEKFKNGVDEVSFLCGAISALVSVGISPNKAMDYIVDKEAVKEAMKHSIEMANIQKDISIETSKLNFVDKANNFC